ncbi:MAG TPA: response regulator [Thermoanaerobaculia bacterium]|nr:response regulator [Thermoanaerobaculia bacterium]
MRARLLIVDDDPAQAAATSLALEAHGYLPQVRNGGAEAVALLRADPGGFSAIVLDLLMPGMNGFEVLRELGSIAPGLRRRTIIATAASPRTLGEFDPASVGCLLLKPFSVEELLEAVESCMDREKNAPAEPAQAHTLEEEPALRQPRARI